MLGVGGVADRAGSGLACAVGADIGAGDRAGGLGVGRAADFGAGADGTAAGRV